MLTGPDDYLGRERAMRSVTPLVIASLLLSISVKAITPGVPPPQSAPDEQPSACERVRITLNNGQKTETNSYQRQGDQVMFTRKGALQRVAARDVKKIEIRQGECPDIVVTLKTGETLRGYRRSQHCALGIGCKTEIRQAGKVSTFAASDIKTDVLKFKTTFGQKVKKVALFPAMAFSYLVLVIICNTKGCDDL